VKLAPPSSSERVTHVLLTSPRVIPQSSLTTLVSNDHSVVLLPPELTFVTGHYIENTSATQNLTWIELYKSDRVADIPLTQWLALTPADIVAAILKIDISVVEKLKKDKQVLIKGN
jgi:oxalate decarboxylase/phosphoglucose isomerase-like protein (cupin superfamily)